MNTRTRCHRPPLLALLSLLFFGQAQAAEDNAASSVLSFENAWIAEAPPGSRVMVAYMQLHNPGKQPVVLTQAESPAFASVEFHETTEKDGVSGMRYHESLRIPAGGSVSLQRGGLHLMLFGPTRPLRAGDRVRFRFGTADGRSIEQSISVRPRD